MIKDANARVENSIVGHLIHKPNQRDQVAAKSIVDQLDFSDLYKLRNALQAKIDAGLIATIPPPSLGYSQLILDECNRRVSEIESKNSDN